MSESELQLLNTPQEILNYHVTRYLDGDYFALLEALRLCCVSASIESIPESLSKEIVRNLDKWFNYDAQTLDEAFSVKDRNRTQIKSKRKKKKLQSLAVVMVENADRKKDGSGQALYEIIAERINDHVLQEYGEKEFINYKVSGSLVRDWHNEMRPIIKKAKQMLLDSKK